MRLLHSAEVKIKTISDEVVARYATVPEVQQIFQEVADDSVTYWIFINKEAYNNGLMDRLIGKEIEIMDMFPDILFGFHYIPLLACPHPQECIAWLSQPIYKRNDGGHH